MEEEEEEVNYATPKGRISRTQPPTFSQHVKNGRGGVQARVPKNTVLQLSFLGRKKEKGQEEERVPTAMITTLLVPSTTPTHTLHL